MSPRPQAPRSWPVLGILPAMRRAPHTALAALQATQGDYATARIGPRTIHLFSDPEACRSLLRASEDDQKKSLFYDKLKSTFGEGLLTSGGDLWRRQRALVQPLLTPRAVQTYAPIVVRTTERLIESWERSAAVGEPVDAGRAATDLARDVTVQALFGEERYEDAGDIAEALAVMQDWTAKRFWSLIDPALFPSRERRRYRRAVAQVHRRIQDMVARRRADPSRGGDLLARLVRACDEAGVMSERQLRDEVTTLYIAGQETTAQAFAFTLLLLARHPEVQEEIRAEADAVLAGRTPEAEDARQLPWTRAAVEESLRLYPPVWSLGRETRQPLEVNGTRLAAGSTCVIAPWILHRRADVWDDPETFCPRRFHTGTVPRAYMPFGAGHRNCVGRDLAMLELVLAVAMILQRFRLADATPHPVAARAYASLKPDPAPRLRLEVVAARRLSA